MANVFLWSDHFSWSSCPVNPFDAPNIDPTNDFSCSTYWAKLGFVVAVVALGLTMYVNPYHNLFIYIYNIFVYI